jgi:hypothetical protein
MGVATVAAAGIAKGVGEKPQHEADREGAQDECDDLLNDEHGIAPSVLIPGWKCEAKCQLQTGK